jgi:hypothetical protein
VNRQKNKKNLIKISNWIVFILILIGCCLATYYITITKINDCTSNPLVYGAKEMTNNYNYEFYGVGYFMTPINTKSPTITFNSTFLSWK